jgi:GNAT superfamily N-acetyltransferase
MDFIKNEIEAKGIKIFLEKNNKEIARARLYILHNDTRNLNYGFLEDVLVDENLRGQGIGTELIKEIIKTAENNNCYKIVATSRNSRCPVHKLYERLGFKNFGIEFKMYLENFNE